MAQQRESPSGQHPADFATLPTAVVKVARAQWYGHHAIVSTTEKVKSRGKISKGLDWLVKKLARTWWQWCHTSTFEPQRKGKVSQRARLYENWIPTSDTLKKACLEEWLCVGGDSPEEQNATDVLVHITEQQTLKERLNTTPGPLRTTMNVQQGR